MQGDDAFQLVMGQGPRPGQIFELPRSTVSIGRDPGNQVMINDSQVSRQHARITPQGGLTILEDLGSTNGTTVNGLRITGPHTLAHGDEIGLGDNVTLIFYGWPTGDADGTVVGSHPPHTDRSQSAYPAAPDAMPVEPPRGEYTKPLRDEYVEPPHSEYAEPLRGEHVEPPHSEHVEPPHSEHVEPPHSKHVEPPHSKHVEPPRGEHVEPPPPAHPPTFQSPAPAVPAYQPPAPDYAPQAAPDYAAHPEYYQEYPEQADRNWTLIGLGCVVVAIIVLLLGMLWLYFFAPASIVNPIADFMNGLGIDVCSIVSCG